MSTPARTGTSTSPSGTVQYNAVQDTVSHHQVPQDRAEEKVQLQEEEQPCGQPHWGL